MTTPQTSKKRGRPPTFDHEESLEKAMQVFWTHGYEGASMAALMEAMGMNKPSIYGAFGNKEALFRKVLQKYLSGPSAFVQAAIHEPTSLQVVRTFLSSAVALLAEQDTPRGCMIVQGALSCGPDAKQIQQELISYRTTLEAMLRERFDLAKKNADLPETANPSTLAKYIAIVHQGISVQAASGAKREELMAVVDLVLQNWPMTNSATDGLTAGSSIS